MKDSEQVTNRTYTRSTRLDAQSTYNKSAITDHISRNNCVIDWKDIKIMDTDNNREKRLIKEAFFIRKNKTSNMNRDSGNHPMSFIWNNLIIS